MRYHLLDYFALSGARRGINHGVRLETEEAAPESRIECNSVDALATRMYNIRGTREVARPWISLQAFRGIAVTKYVDFWDFLGSRDLEGYQMWA